jgi:hypothetical protein
MDEPPLAADVASFRRFHADLLPARIAAGNGALAFADLADLGTLAIRTPAGSWTYVPGAGSVELLEGEATADAVVAVDLDAWLGLVSDLDTAPGLFYTDRASVPVGNPLRFMRWEPGLRALFHGLPVFDPDSVDLRDLGGGPLDTTRSFTLEETGDTGRDGAAARHFLRTAGYLHVPGVFDADEVAAMLTDADILAGEARPGDMASWWGRDAAGTEVLTRVLRAASRPDLRLLVDDARIRRVVDTADEAQFMIAFVCEEHLQDLEGARRAYQALIDNYPNAELVDQARQLLEHVGQSPDEWVTFQEGTAEDPQ